MRVWLPVAILSAWLLAALLGPLLPTSPNRIELAEILGGPSIDAWLGHDELGRSVSQRLVAGARTSFLVAFAVVSVSVVMGTFIGIVSAWLGGLWDHVIVRLTDVFLAFPGILLAIALAGILGPGIENVVLALAAVGWVGFARLARAQALSVKHREHVQAAIALGSRTPRILWRHVLPLVAAPLIVEATFGVAGVIIAEAGLSFLGLGVQPPAASWGSIIREGTRYMLVAPHLVQGPAAVLLAVVVSVNLLGDWLRDRMDVRGRPRTREPI